MPSAARSDRNSARRSWNVARGSIPAFCCKSYQRELLTCPLRGDPVLVGEHRVEVAVTLQVRLLLPLRREHRQQVIGDTDNANLAAFRVYQPLSQLRQVLHLLDDVNLFYSKSTNSQRRPRASPIRRPESSRSRGMRPSRLMLPSTCSL